MLITALLMAGALTEVDPARVVAHAPATSVDLAATSQPIAPSPGGAAQSGVPLNLTTAEQIDRWLAARPTDEQPYERPRGESRDDGALHGEVSVSVGTGGYREYGAAVSMPVGENGRLDLSYRQIENGYPYVGYGYGGGYGDGYAIGRSRGDSLLDDSGYVFPGNRPGAAAEFDGRVGRSDGRPGWRVPNQQPRDTH